MQKQKEKEVEEMELKIIASKVNLLAAQNELQSKDEELRIVKLKRNGQHSMINELQFELNEKEKFMSHVWEEVRIKSKLLEDALRTNQTYINERAIILNQMMQLRNELNASEDTANSYEDVKVENRRLAELFFESENVIIQLHE